MTEQEVLEALRELYRREGTQTRLAQLAGITQSTINAYLGGRAKIENMPLGVFMRLFRNMRIDFFGDAAATPEDSIRNELLHIYDGLSLSDKTRLLSLAAANFGDKLRGGRK